MVRYIAGERKRRKVFECSTLGKSAFQTISASSEAWVRVFGGRILSELLVVSK